jgi:hypothetical protein
MAGQAGQSGQSFIASKINHYDEEPLAIIAYLK